MTKHASYLAAVDAYLTNDRTALERFIDSTETDRVEKALIETRMRFKAGEYALAHQTLDGVTPQTALLRGDHAFLRACLLSFESKWEDAAINAHMAIAAFLECNYERGLFIAHYNLSVYYNRLGLEQLSLTFLSRAEQWQRNANQTGLVLRAKACDASKKLDYSQAILFLEEALSLIAEMDPVDQTSLEYVAADIYFRAGHQQIALSLLERLNHSKVVRDKARVRFELTVLRALIDDSSTLVESRMPEVVQGNEEYALSWKILETLQTGDLSLARSHWAKLTTLLPQKFAADFATVNPSDAKTVFMTAVQRLRRANQQPAIKLDHLEGKQRQLVELLQSTDIYLRKEEIIERLWQVKYDPSYDNRFYKLITRLRKESSVRVVVVANTYRLVS